jgi:transposase InsO family protein
MIPQILHQLGTMKKTTGLPWRKVCDEVPYSSVMRWRYRQQHGLPVWQCPGPKKTVPLNWEEFYPLLSQLNHGRVRTRGAGDLYRRFAESLSRRELAGLMEDYRRDRLASMKRIDWLYTGLAWSIDATEYGPDGIQIIPVMDMRSRYRLEPLVTNKLDGQQIALHLEKLFKKHGPPLFLKRDNGSPFNHEAVNQVLDRYGVVPLNNPPYYPRYNGGKEKSIRDLKTALDQRQPSTTTPQHLTLAIEVTTHDLNHRPRRCLKGRTACAVFHDESEQKHWDKRQRKEIFRLLLQRFGAMIGNTANGHHPRPATLWRVSVESWLRCQNLIVVRKNKNVSPTFTKLWSQN